MTSIINLFAAFGFIVFGVMFVMGILVASDIARIQNEDRRNRR